LGDYIDSEPPASAPCGNHNQWRTTMEMHTTRSDAKHANRSNRSRMQSKSPEQKAADNSVHHQIETLLPRLTRYARVLTHDAVAAEDLVQECLTRALGKIHLWEQGTDLRAWLFTILHHQHVSRTRRDARQRYSIELQGNTPGLALSPSQTVRLELRDLERAIAQLPKEQRLVILLVGLKGMRYDEAAAVVNLPVGTVRSRVSRGRQALRAMTGLFPSRHSRRASVTVNSVPSTQQTLAAATLEPISVSRSQEIFQ
jgi:RNA polymerase sigma-70 factor, ECF subfamily